MHRASLPVSEVVTPNTVGIMPPEAGLSYSRSPHGYATKTHPIPLRASSTALISPASSSSLQGMPALRPSADARRRPRSAATSRRSSDTPKIMVSVPGGSASTMRFSRASVSCRSSLSSWGALSPSAARRAKNSDACPPGAVCPHRAMNVSSTSSSVWHRTRVAELPAVRGAIPEDPVMAMVRTMGEASSRRRSSDCPARFESPETANVGPFVSLRSTRSMQAVASSIEQCPAWRSISRRRWRPTRNLSAFL
mmetsp:Transcript_38159/g.90183  ORF Transcript_38159/g.90183 Transcript_38159/m.90183 type:complete len:252 (-) Transcript_38159:344-1099(-)